MRSKRKRTKRLWLYMRKAPLVDPPVTWDSLTMATKPKRHEEQAQLRQNLRVLGVQMTTWSSMRRHGLQARSTRCPKKNEEIKAARFL
jgi:hypothetical protein